MTTEQQTILRIMAAHGGRLTVPWLLWDDAALADLRFACLIRCVPARCPEVTVAFELTADGQRKLGLRHPVVMH
jgi:hypothetical protein